MQNLVDTVLTHESMTVIQGYFQGILQQLPFEQAQSKKQRKKAGWMASDKALILMQRALRSARQHPQLLSPQINADAFERDLTLIAQLSQIDVWVSDLKRRIEDTKLYLHGEAGPQGLLIYNQLKLAADAGYGAEAAVAEMRELMPATGKKRKQKEKEIN